MKKAIFILLLASVLAFTFVTSALAGSVLDRILQRGELVVGTAGTQPPLNATTKTGEIIGLDADISRLIAMNMGVNVKFVTLPFPDLLPALEAGKVDMILSSMTMTPDRNLKVAFVGPYFVSGKGILTKAETVASLQDTAGLNKPNFRVAALKDSTSQTFVQKAAPLAKLVTTKTYDEAIDMLNQDKIDALIADFPFCAVSALRFRDKGLTAGQARLTFEPLGIAVPEDTLLINFLQNFMGVLEGSGALKKISERWFNNASWLNQLP
jgi:polar amino acid transport system substrate-binding protein